MAISEKGKNVSIIKKTTFFKWQRDIIKNDPDLKKNMSSMKYLLIILFTSLYSACNTSQPKVRIQTMKDSSCYSNKQLAYIKKENIVEFYDYKGRLRKKMDLTTRIEKRYNITDEIVDYSISKHDYIINIGAGNFSFPDAYIVSKGTQIDIGETGVAISEKDKNVSIIKNNLGYPANFKFNNTGQIIEQDQNKIEYDDLGRIISKMFYSNNTIYSNIKYIYENGNLVKSIHSGQNAKDNFVKEYEFNSFDKLSRVVNKNQNTINSITYFEFEKELLKSKRIYTQYENYTILQVIEYSYKEKKIISEKIYKTNPNSDIKLTSFSNEKDILNIFNYEKNSKSIELIEYEYQSNNLTGIRYSEYDKIKKSLVEKTKINYKYNTKGQLVAILDNFNEVSNSFLYDIN